MVRRQVADLCGGTTRDFLNQKILSSIVFPFPPLEEQKRILTEVELLLSIDESMATLMGDTQRHVQSLRQSILSWVFEGKLVDQDPTDEPASVLLERIRAERARRAQADGNNAAVDENS